MTDAEKIADQWTIAYEKWMGLHFDDDDVGLRRFLLEATGLREAVEKLETGRDWKLESADRVYLQLQIDALKNLCAVALSALLGETT